MASKRSTSLEKERHFFFWMAAAISIAAVGGFSSDILARDVWFTDFPLTVHLHAVVFSTWVILYVVQNWLVADGIRQGAVDNRMWVRHD